MTYQEGDPNHIGVHNDLVTSVDKLASDMGVDVNLPPTRQLGDSGHVGDHNTIQTALDKIAAEGSAGASWAQVISAPDAVTKSYYDDKGGQWAYYEWNAPGSFSVELSGGLVWVLAVGGGSWAYSSSNYLNMGQPGLVNEGLWEFGPGTHTVTVGKKGEQNAPDGTKLGQPSSIGDYGTQGLVSWGDSYTGRGAKDYNDETGYKSRITGNESEYATGYQGADVPGRGGRHDQTTNNPGCVIIATAAPNAKALNWVHTTYHAEVSDGVVTAVHSQKHYADGTTTPLPFSDLVDATYGVSEGWLFVNGELQPPPEPPAPTRDDLIAELEETLKNLRSAK